MNQEILVLCPFGVDAGLISKAADLSKGNVRVLVPAAQQEAAALASRRQVRQHGAQNIAQVQLAAGGGCKTSGGNIGHTQASVTVVS